MMKSIKGYRNEGAFNDKLSKAIYTCSCNSDVCNRKRRQIHNSFPMFLPLSASKPHIAGTFLELFNNAASPVEVIGHSCREKVGMNE
jgi:hypothetical protein